MSLASQVLPIFFLIAVGVLARRFSLIGDDAVDGFKQLVVRLVLPAVLFLSFVDMDLSSRHASLVLMVFAVCVVALAIGWRLVGRLFPTLRFAPFLMSGYEFGMLGIGLFVGAYGTGALPTIAVVGLGHELFIWFVYFAFLIARRDGSARPADLLLGFLRNPVTVAILAGLAFNFLGIGTPVLERLPGIDAVIRTLRMLTPLIAPLVLIIVGHGLRFESTDLSAALRLIGLRLALQIPLALIAAFVIVGPVLGFDARFEVAVFGLMILPPPFIIPLFMPAGAEALAERRLILQVLTAHTLVSLLVFAAVIAAVPTF